MAAALIASGIDPKRSIIFAQSAVPAHSELCWILNGTARMGWLNRMTQWKDKAGKNREGRRSRCSTIPCSRRPTSCSTSATHVPVGEDQKQHIELTRDIALKFNTDYDTDLFVVPEPFIGGGAAARVMSLRDGQAKMSKSDPSEASRIHLTDSDEEIAQKIRKAKTDPEPLPDQRRWPGRTSRGQEPGRDLRRDHRQVRRRCARAFRWPGLRRVQTGPRRRRGRLVAPIRAPPRRASP